MDSEHFRSACLRACTFELLPLAHTCCNESGREVHPEERLEIWDEDALELDRLEALIEEFETEFAKMGCSLTKFMETYWSERMGFVLREIECQRLREDEIQNIEALGVSLQIQHRDNDVEEDLSEVGYWYRKLDTLVV
ncbi:hypothetical protein CCHR01_03602 [Colletotrichum chrysophilum]|uniref:Uncharacterized protein n=1 Tax=Colletotrichum chrysophilum TaxID=1836956 RepID=A0AAD9ATE4_9PEZI|nr:hypothetical protein CCHR01_03602 [Colletotrichum chrysophilum]